ncbi:hypothetical protein AB0M20_21305 [Actinoplanes sp. NPDC051633]|uniref:hypothetical protein n=1 Tax=Actinoplanes sp. NPDC051633 TaxID=3155670 RepID=UPI0034195461
MSESPLSTHAGSIAVGAGGLFAAAHLGMFVTGDRSDLVAMMKDPLFLPFNSAYALAFPLLLIALVAMYERQARAAGGFGAVAFCTAATGTVALAGDMWFEGFAVPWLAQVAPATFEADRSGTLLSAAWLVSVVLFALGWALFGLASWRARSLPPALSVALAVAGAVGFQAAIPPWGVPLGLAVAAAGIWIIRQDRTTRRLKADPDRGPFAAASR